MASSSRAGQDYVYYGDCPYLVTARHVAEALEPPFAMRATLRTGEPVLIDEIIEASWFFHPDPTVDVAAVVGKPPGVPGLAQETILTPEMARERDVGIGDECYIVGLYRLLHGRKKNVPIVHTGHIALMPGEERIRQRDRRTGEARDVEVYLIEAQTLEGLSGSPVFVRHIWRYGSPEDREAAKEKAFLLGDAFLLGVWSGAWDAPPGEVLSLQRPEARRVPVGMGLAVSIEKLLELWEQPEVVAHRERRLAEESAAKQDDALVRPEGLLSLATDGNPHQKDFNRLLNAAARKP